MPPTLLPVAFVISQAGARADGGVRSISLIIEALADREDIRPLVVTNAETPQTEAWRARGFEVHVRTVPAIAARGAGLGQRAWRAGRLIAENLWLRSLLASRGIRVVHCNDKAAVWIAALAAHGAGAAVVTNIRGTLGLHGPSWRLLRLLSTRVVVLSDEMRTWVEAALPPPAALPAKLFAPVERIYSIVDSELLRPADLTQRARLRLELGLPQNGKILVLVAAFGPLKQQLDLLRHLAAHPDAVDASTQLCFVGDFVPESDPYAEACRAAAERLGGRVRLVGFTTEPRPWYQVADVTLVPSVEEGLARCMIESLACGTPVVSFDVCSAREFLGEAGGGVVVRKGDFAALCDEAVSLAGDAQRARGLGLRGRALVQERCHPARVVSAYRRLYEGLSRR
jgi:glycosyltransferase involved in cell wall biosynthesis